MKWYNVYNIFSELGTCNCPECNQKYAAQAVYYPDIFECLNCKSKIARWNLDGLVYTISLDKAPELIRMIANTLSSDSRGIDKLNELTGLFSTKSMSNGMHGLTFLPYPAFQIDVRLQNATSINNLITLFSETNDSKADIKLSAIDFDSELRFDPLKGNYYFAAMSVNDFKTGLLLIGNGYFFGEIESIKSLRLIFASPDIKYVETDLVKKLSELICALDHSAISIISRNE